MESIKEVMLKEHGKANVLIEKLDKDVQESSPDTKKDFNELRLFLKAHFYVEDEAIFNIFTTMKEREVSSIFDLMQEHGIILGNLSDIERAINKNQPIDIAPLKKNFREHSLVEERFF